MFRRAKKRQVESAEHVSKKCHQQQHRICNPNFPEDVTPLGDTKGKSTEEIVLEQLVLGGDEDVVSQLDHVDEKRKKKRKTKRLAVLSEGKKPVWEDEDDAKIVDVTTKRALRHRDKEQEVSGDVYTQRLKSQFEKFTGTPSWAQLKWEKDEVSDEDSDVEELMHKTGDFLTGSEALPRGVLDYKVCADVNKESPAQGRLHSVEFHPTAQVMLTAGSGRTLSLFQVDGEQNPKIQSVYIEGGSMPCAHFTTDGEQVVMGTEYPNFNYYDLIAGRIINVPRIKALEERRMDRFVMSPDGKWIIFLGKSGYIHFLSAKSKEWIHTTKMNGHISSATFTPDGSKLFTFGDEGSVYVWDMRTRDCIHRFVDDGCTRGTSITCSKNSQYLATGSNSGVVNIYETDTCLTSPAPRPLKSIMNLTTPCTDMTFNSATEILALSSNGAERATKLVHFPSMTVFKNFPERTDAGLRIPRCMDFSLHSGYFCIGTHKGTALLYRLKHYGNY